MLQEASGNTVLGVSTIKRWYKMFLDGRESSRFELGGGKLKTVCMVTNIDTVVTAIEDDGHQWVLGLITEF